MGSLMAGWGSHVPDPKSAKFQRNRSLTKEDIDTYWRSKKDKDQLPIPIPIPIPITPPSLSHGNQGGEHAIENDFKRSNSLPPTLEPHHGERMEKQFNKNGWWIGSNWAFLNEPPVILTEAPTYKYASQFHVTNSKPKVDPPITT